MPLITSTVPSLIGGVSQQPASLRLPNQCEEQENALPMLVGGLIKRPPTNHVKEIREPYGDSGATNPVDLSSSFTHVVTRDTEDEFLVSLDGSGSVKVTDISPSTGEPVARVVHYDVGTIGDDHYLKSDNPQKDFRAVSIADVTFIVNTSKTVAMSATKSPYSGGSSSPVHEALIWIKTGGYGVDFTIKKDSDDSVYRSFTGTTETDEDPPGTTMIASALAGGTPPASNTATGSWSGIDTKDSKGSVVYVKDASALQLTVEDSLGQSAHTVCSESDDDASGVMVASNFTDVPEIAKKDMIIKVDGNPEASIDDYYIKFVPNSDGTSLRRGIWQETLAPNIDQEFDYSTMPHLLIRQSDGTFVVKKADGTSTTAATGGEKASLTLEFPNRPMFVKKDYQNDTWEHQIDRSASIKIKALKSDGTFDTKEYVFTRWTDTGVAVSHLSNGQIFDSDKVYVSPENPLDLTSNITALGEAIDRAQGPSAGDPCLQATSITVTDGIPSLTIKQLYAGVAGNTEVTYKHVPYFAHTKIAGSWKNWQYMAYIGPGAYDDNAYHFRPYGEDPDKRGGIDPAGVNVAPFVHSMYIEYAKNPQYTDSNYGYEEFGAARWSGDLERFDYWDEEFDKPPTDMDGTHIVKEAKGAFSGGTDGISDGGYLPDGAASDIYSNFKFTPRSAGNDETNPLPSFVGSRINDITFFKNRLVLLSGENVVLSEVGEYFNYFRTTTTQLLDSDVIDVGVGGTEVNELFTASPFSDRLILFSTKTQFALQGEAVLSPSTASISQVTNFDINTDVHPITVGPSLFFAFNRGDYAGMREFFRTGSTDIEYDASETTLQIPRYIKGPVTKVAASSHEDILAVLGTNSNDIYVYKFYKGSEGLIQSAWCKFKLGGKNLKIIDIRFIRQSLYIIVVRDGHTYVERMDLRSGITDENSDYVTCLDRRTKITAPSNGFTLTVDSSCILGEEDEISVVSADGETMTIESVSYNNGTSADTITLKEEFQEGDVFYVGVPYTMRYEASMPILKRAKSSGGFEVVAVGRHQIRYMTVVYDDTSYFKVRITPKVGGHDGDSVEYNFSGRYLSAGGYLGSTPTESGDFRFPVFAESNSVKIEIINDSPLPSNIQALTFEASYTSRSTPSGL